MADPQDVGPADIGPEDAGASDDLLEEEAYVDRGRLRSFKDVNMTVGQFMAGLEQKILHNRPPAIVVAEEEARSAQVETNGLVIGNLPVNALDRPEPPDDSGVTL